MQHHRVSRLVMGRHSGHADAPEWLLIALPLQQATFRTGETFHADCGAASLHSVNSRGAVLCAQGRQSPSGGVQHTHSALAIDHYDHILIAFTLKSGVQDVLCLP
jgi:hypothetical protein